MKLLATLILQLRRELQPSRKRRRLRRGVPRRVDRTRRPLQVSAAKRLHARRQRRRGQRETLQLEVGTLLDRFGSEYGIYKLPLLLPLFPFFSGSSMENFSHSDTLQKKKKKGTYVWAASAPFSQRSLSPSSLDTDPGNPDFPYGYHLYKVIRPFGVVGGPIAPWFGQPGLGRPVLHGRRGQHYEAHRRRLHRALGSVDPGDSLARGLHADDG